MLLHGPCRLMHRAAITARFWLSLLVQNSNSAALSAALQPLLLLRTRRTAPPQFGMPSRHVVVCIQYHHCIKGGGCAAKPCRTPAHSVLHAVSLPDHPLSPARTSAAVASGAELCPERPQGTGPLLRTSKRLWGPQLGCCTKQHRQCSASTRLPRMLHRHVRCNADAVRGIMTRTAPVAWGR